MRHVFGFILGVVLVPAVVVVSGWAADRLEEIAGFGGDFVSLLGLSTVAAMGVLALVLGVCVAVVRVSALAPGLAGLVLGAWTVLYVVRPELAVVPLPGSGWGEGARRLLSLGLYLPVAVVLFLPMLMPSRWRRVRSGGEEDEEHFDDLAEDYEQEQAPLARRGRPADPRDDYAPGDYGDWGGRHARGPASYGR